MKSIMMLRNIRVSLIWSLMTLFLSSALESEPLYLTTFIDENRLSEVRNRSLVDPQHFLNVTSHAGFITVDKEYNSNMFFWYFPVAKPKVLEKTPWIIWLQGGPGATSLYGLFDEIGPFYYDGTSLKLRQWSWWNEYSLVFIDNPVGTGFSFTDDGKGFSRNSDMYSKNLFSTVSQLVALFPELGKAPLYIAGESYAGRYIPGLAMEILKASEKGPLSFTLKGLIMGNPTLDREGIVDYISVFYHFGMIDQQGAAAARHIQDQFKQAVDDGDNHLAYKLRNELLDKLQDISFQPQLYNMLNDVKNLDGFNKFMDTIHIEALHVGKRLSPDATDSVRNFLIEDFLNHVSPKIEALLEHYKILLYCGQLDLTVPCVPTAKYRRAHWHWSGRQQFLNAPRLSWWHNDTVAGYVKSGGNFTEVVVRGAGHLAPMDKPAEVFQLIYHFIEEINLPRPPDYEIEDIPLAIELESDVASTSGGLIVSLLFNVIFVVIILTIALWFWRRRRQRRNSSFPLSDDMI